MEKLVYSVREAAEALGISYTNLRKLVQDGVIPSVRISPRRIVIPLDNLREYLKSRADVRI